MKKKIRINWSVVVYLLRKAISKFGYISTGAFIVALVEYGACWETIIGLSLGLALGIVATIDNEDPTL